MKFKWEKKYLYWGITALAVIICSTLFYFFMGTIGVILKSILGIFKVLKPVLFGIVIAYLMNPIYMFFSKQLNSLFEKKSKNKEKLQKRCNGFGILIAVIIFIVCIFGLLWVVIPQLFESIKSIVSYIPSALVAIEEWVTNYFSGSAEVESAVATVIDNISNSVNNWSQNELLPNMASIVTNITDGITSILIFVKDFALGLVIAIYFLASKKMFINQTKKFTYSVFGTKVANKILEIARYTDDMIKKVIGGKLITSSIVAVATFVVMTIFGWPYPMLISVIVGVTNMIPFFGPWIGGIPSVLLILMVNPKQALYFGIFCLVIQQIEGNFLEPKIVGKKTGLSSFWVLFAILLFGSLFGIVGMLIGVPIFAIIYHFAGEWLAKLSAKRRVPVESDKYENIVHIDEENGKVVKIEK